MNYIATDLSELDNKINSLVNKDKYMYKVMFGRKFVLVFHQFINEGRNVFTPNNVLHNENADTYSILDKLDDLRYSNSNYEFILEYPTESVRAYNWFVQTSNPTKSTTITGYYHIWLNMISNNWGGLARSTSSNSCFIDGSPNANTYFYAIGCYNAWQNGIPAETGAVQTVNLWLRCK